MNDIGSYKCLICMTPQSDLNIINNTQDQFVEIVNIIVDNVNGNDKLWNKFTKYYNKYIELCGQFKNITKITSICIQ